MTKYLALMGMGMNMRNSSALGNIIPKANSMPNTAPEAPMVMMLLRTSRVWDHPIIDSVLAIASCKEMYHVISCMSPAPIPVIM